MSKNFQELAKKALEEANERKSEDKSKLIEQLKKINDQISTYPTPIAGCDAQFNYLLEEKERISKIIASNKGRDQSVKEINGPKGPEPTRYGDWEKKGIVSDF